MITLRFLAVAVLSIVFVPNVRANHDHDAQAAIALAIAMKPKPTPTVATTVPCQMCGQSCNCNSCGCDAFHAQAPTGNCANGQCIPQQTQQPFGNRRVFRR